MSRNLDAIHQMSDRFWEEVEQLPTLSGMGLGGQERLIGHTRGGEVVAAGENVLRMYEAELAQADGDPVYRVDVNLRLGYHLYRMGCLYYDAVVWRNVAERGSQAAGYAEKACGYLKRSVDVSTPPSPVSALLLADIFGKVGYYATAIHWLHVAEESAALIGIAEEDEARAKRFKMALAGLTADPRLSLSAGFPGPDTLGLIKEYQPTAAPPSLAGRSISKQSPPKKGGPCFVATACYGDFDHPDVQVLRAWRDRVLLPSPLGRVMVSLYYRMSPPVAEAIEKAPLIARFVRQILLQPLAGMLRWKKATTPK